MAQIIKTMSNNDTLQRELQSKKFINSFPNLEQEAEYNQLFQIIQFNYISEPEFSKIQSEGIDETNYLTAGTIRHELTHYWDHIGTLWGQKNLILLFNALNAYATGNIEEYWRIKTLHQQCRRDVFSPYYTEVYKEHQGTFNQPWTTKVSSGVRFDANGKVDYQLPLLFVRCYKSDGTELARTPLCVASLLETNAVFEEYKLKSAFISQLDGEKSKNENELLHGDIESFFYATDLALYNVAAHLVAKTHGLTDAIEIYRLASALSSISLNLPDESINGIRIKVLFDEKLDERLRAMADNGDRGFAYYRLNENLADQFRGEPYSIHHVLEASGLPDFDALELKIIEIMTLNAREITPGPFNWLGQMLLNYGTRLFTKRGIDGQKPGFDEWVATEQPWPYFLFNDTIFDPDKIDLQEAFDRLLEKPGEGDLSDHYKVMAYYHDKMNEFYEACGL